MKKFSILSLIAVLSLIPFVEANAATINQSFEGGMDVEITYPDSVVVDRDFQISILTKNNGWEEKQDVSYVFTNKDGAFVPITSNELIIPKISEGGSFGDSLKFNVDKETTPGKHFLNLEYSQVLVANNEEPQQPFTTNIAIPIEVKQKAKVVISTVTPESIFANAEFPFIVNIAPQDTDISDVTIEIVPPRDIQFRGETMHTFSSIQQSDPVSITARIMTPEEEVKTEYKVPFQIRVTYTDDVGEEKMDSKTISLVLRPRTFMELTTDGGIWVGDFFIAPYVSLGTIIGIPAGAIFSLLLRKKFEKTKKRKRKTSTKSNATKTK